MDPVAEDQTMHTLMLNMVDGDTGENAQHHLQYGRGEQVNFPSLYCQQPPMHMMYPPILASKHWASMKPSIPQHSLTFP